MKVAFDIGGVLSKYPHEFRTIAQSLHTQGHDVFVITDMHDKDEVVKTLIDNGFAFILPQNVYCADYTNKGEFCKAILAKQLGIEVIIDDFPGYIQWDSALGPAPVRLLVAPDGFKPYWHKDWIVQTDSDFGRRVSSVTLFS